MISTEDCVVQLVNDGFVQLPNARSYDEFLSTLAEYTQRNDKDQEYFIQDYHLRDVLVFLQSTQFHNYALYKNGSLFLQDKASCVPTYLLAPPPGSVVFDTCAAPGNKTLHLAAYMQNKGKVYAVDKDPKRFKYMKEVVDLAEGSAVVETILSDIFEIKMTDYTDVEYVLVDPSCSGTGITERAKIDNHQRMSASRIKNLSGFQKDLLGRVCSYFPNVQRIVYCTCSVQEEENEQVVEDVIGKHGERFQVEDLRHHPALKGWKHFGSEKYPHGQKCFYALPSDYCTGFFAAVLNRVESGKCEGDKSESAHEVRNEISVESFDGGTRKKKKKKKKSRDDENDDVSPGGDEKKRKNNSVQSEDAEMREEGIGDNEDLPDDVDRVAYDGKKKKRKHKRKDLDEETSHVEEKKRKKNREREENCSKDKVMLEEKEN